MKFLIQKIDNQIRHDFSFTLHESVRFQNWLHHEKHFSIRYKNTWTTEGDKIQPFEFSKFQSKYIPIGSVEFVIQFLEHFHGLTPKPRNVPESLRYFAGRGIFNGTEKDVYIPGGRTFVKSNDKIKGFQTVLRGTVEDVNVPPGNYQISDAISIDSEWRAFVYKGKLVGLQHYVGEFTLFPHVSEIKRMIEAFKDCPIAYTLDVGVSDVGTFVIEVHDFFSCGLYGFSAHNILPQMFGRWFTEYVNKNKIK